MKQTALALQNYHDAKGCLPSGITTSGPTANKRAGWFVYLLPFVEYADLYSRINWSVFALQNSATIIEAPVPVVWCPSDPYSRLVKPRGIYGNYSGNVGAMACDYAWQGGTDGIFYIESKMKMKNVSDGLSKTLAASEIMVTPEPIGGGLPVIDTRGRYHNNLHGGCSFSTFYPPNTTVSDQLPYCSNAVARAPCVGGSGANHVISARSYHPSGVNTVMADGSVRFVTDQVTPSVWQAAGSRNGGESNNALE
jgi:prepilin-type processing-associated H-X9-DG protein